MRFTSRIKEYFALLLVASLPAGAAVTVSFPGDRHYADIGTPGPDAEAVKTELASHLQALGVRYLSARDNLRIEVVDVDLAGEREFIGGREIRVARGGADWPRITLRYTLDSGAATRSGEETIADSSYLWFPTRSRPAESLYHEKRLLDAWFKERFAR